MHVNIELSGTTPLVMHNIQLADKDCKFTREIAALTAKKKHQTDADRADIARLEWQGGLYLDSNNKIIMPMANLIKMFREAGAATRRGKDIARSVVPRAISVPLIYSGPTDLNKLYADRSFAFSALVKVGASKIKRVRPCFPKWKVVADFELLEDLMDLRDLEAIVARAGLTTGLGDARILGYGRFEARVMAVELAEAAE
jgi:hypothetical protein